MTRIVAFGNCQAEGLQRVLRIGLPGDDEVSYYSNNPRTGNMVEPETLLDAVRQADLIVFQPLRREYGALSEDSIREASRQTGAALAFPYIFNSGMAGLCWAPKARRRPTGRVFGEEAIVDLLRDGRSVDDVVEAYVGGEIDFELRRRFDRSLKVMRRRESSTEIKLCDYVERNYQTRKQFIGHNHPTTDLLVEVCRQIHSHTDLPIDMDALHGIEDENEAGLSTGRAPISPHDATALGYEFQPDEEWEQVGAGLIRRIADDFEADPASFDTDRDVAARRRETPQAMADR